MKASKFILGIAAGAFTGIFIIWAHNTCSKAFITPENVQNDTGLMVAQVWEDKTGYVKSKKLVKPKGLLFQLTNRLKFRF